MNNLKQMASSQWEMGSVIVPVSKPVRRRQPKRRNRTRAAQAFTLIELLVVMVIVALLIGIVLSVGTTLGEKSDISRTESTIKILDAALDEYKSQADRQLTFGGGPSFDLNPGTPHVYSASEVLRIISRPSDIRSILAQVNTDDAPTYDSGNPQPPEWISAPRPDEPDPAVGSWSFEFMSGAWDDIPAVLDAWELPIRFVHPGFVPPAGTPGTDPDGTERTPQENIYGVCINREPFFVSSGPDREFGNLQLPVDDRVHQLANDNIYSYEPERP